VEGLEARVNTGRNTKISLVVPLKRKK